MSATEHADEGVGLRGFGRSERRTCPGGSCWRRWEPHQASRDHGRGYESWEWSSGTTGAGWAAAWLRGREGVRPSRVDVAFDFACGPEYRSDDWAEAVRPHAEAQRLTLGIAGQGDVNTRYVGSRTSDRRVRVYRKDLQQAAVAELFGPTLRVELVLRAEQARRFWLVWDADPEAAKRAAAGELARMTGVKPLEGSDTLPDLETPEAASEAQQLALFVEQHGERLDAWAAAGIDVVALAQERAWERRATSRKAAWRARRRAASIEAAGGGRLVERLARVLLGADRLPMAM